MMRIITYIIIRAPEATIITGITTLTAGMAIRGTRPITGAPPSMHGIVPTTDTMIDSTAHGMIRTGPIMAGQALSVSITEIHGTTVGEETTIIGTGRTADTILSMDRTLTGIATVIPTLSL
jgi:hypothetical protein